MNDPIPLREGDRITYRYESDDAGEFRTSDRLTAKDASLSDPRHGFYITYASGRTAGGIEDVTLVERHGLPVEVHEISDWGQCVIYTSVQDTDGMHFMQHTRKGYGISTSLGTYPDIASRLGLPKGHPLVDDPTDWDWITPMMMDDAGIDRSSWPTPLRYGNDGPTGDEDVDEASAALQARIAELEATLTAEREERKREMLDYKEQVKAAARRVGADKGWCVEGQNDVLTDLGIETKEKYRVSIALEFDMVAFTDNDGPTRGFAQDSLDQLRSMGEVVAALRELIDLDSDWDDIVFDESTINFRVTGVEEEK